MVFHFKLVLRVGWELIGLCDVPRFYWNGRSIKNRTKSKRLADRSARRKMASSDFARPQSVIIRFDLVAIHFQDAG